MRWGKKGRGLTRPLVFAFFSLLLMMVRATQAAETKVPVTFEGGHETDRRDGGRRASLLRRLWVLSQTCFARRSAE